MSQLSELELENWMALYAATAICCAFAAILAIAAVIAQLYQERAWTKLDTLGGMVLFVPRAWWRWQKLYFLSTPVTLAIVASFALHLSWR